MTLPMSRVVRIVARTSDLGRLSASGPRAWRPDDVAGWLDPRALGARSRDLLTQAREAYEHVSPSDPENAAAHRALGHVLGGRPVGSTREEATAPAASSRSRARG